MSRKKTRGCNRAVTVLIRILAEDRPDDLAEAYEHALSQGPRWRDRIASSLGRMPATKDLLRGLS